MRIEEKQRLCKVNDCFLNFTTDPDMNIQHIVNCCGELMGAACALYNRIQEGMLYTPAQWNAPPDFNPLDRPDGHICHDVIKTGGKAVFVVRNLHLTSYAETDPNVSAYCLKTYIGAPVSCNHQCVGSLCVVYQSDYVPDEDEKKMLQILATALGVEEERRQEAVALRELNEQLRQEINERKRAEAEVRRMNDELEQKVAERTSQLLDVKEELVRKEKLAMLGQLAGSVGHELRNPLGVMNNAVYFLKSIITDADAAVMEYLDIIKQEIDNSQRIVSDLNDLFHIKPPHPSLITLVELVRQSIEKCAVPENVWLLTEIPDTLHSLKVDPLQISQVFQHLITNSIQAMPAGGTLIIKAQEDLESGILKTSFIDTGEGISPDNMKKLFQPLFTTKARGVGLGLTICRNFTETNGGRIEVESRPGEGTTFTVMLPMATELNQDCN
jgi:signal transduction histidine kinase